jgi:hypothetical protein
MRNPELWSKLEWSHEIDNFLSASGMLRRELAERVGMENTTVYEWLNPKKLRTPRNTPAAPKLLNLILSDQIKDFLTHTPVSVMARRGRLIGSNGVSMSVTRGDIMWQALMYWPELLHNDCLADQC